MRRWRTTGHENGVQRRGFGTQVSLCGTSIRGERLLEGRCLLCDDTDPANKNPGCCRATFQIVAHLREQRQSRKGWRGVATDVFGTSGRLMLRVLIEGKAQARGKSIGGAQSSVETIGER